MIKVSKFGGSSVASAEQFKKVKGIVKADPDRKFVVVSAAGKRFSGDNKLTDLLLLVNAHIEYHVDCTSLLKDIEQRFVEIRDALNLKYPIEEKFEEFSSVITSLSPEYIVSRGSGLPASSWPSTWASRSWTPRTSSCSTTTAPSTWSARQRA